MDTFSIDNAARKCLSNNTPNNWSLTPPIDDFGIDYWVQITSSSKSTGLSFYLQLKGTRSPKYHERFLHFQLETAQLLRYTVEGKPIILVICDVSNVDPAMHKGYYIFIQDYVALELVGRNQGKPNWWTKQQTVTIRIPTTNNYTKAECENTIFAFIEEGNKKISKKGGLINKKTKPKFKESEIMEVADQLQYYYVQDEIWEGAVMANQAYSKFGSHPQILKHVFRFNMRLKEWELVRDIAKRVIDEKLSDMITTQCYLAMFECELREANSNLKGNKVEQSKKILQGKKLLNQVPESHRNYCQYLYWNGKWYLELWYSTGGLDISHLTQALTCFEKAMKQKYTWWYHCYKCIVLKLLNSKTVKEEINSFTKTITEEKQRQPMRPAIRTYRITSFILNDDLKGLKKFLNEHISPYSATDFQSTIFHHIDLIYFKDPQKHDLYSSILEGWISNLPVK